MIVVRADCDDGTLSRYESGGGAVRLTHRYRHDVRPVAYFDWAVLQDFRTSPPDDCRIDPPPRPTNSPAGAGTILQEAA